MDLCYVVFKSCKLGLSVGTSMNKGKTWGCDVNQRCLNFVYKTCKSIGENQ